MKIAAIYARVSSDQQKDDNTIASQTAALIDFAQSHGYSVPADLIFEDDGYSGASLVRPGLERDRYGCFADRYWMAKCLSLPEVAISLAP